MSLQDIQWKWRGGFGLHSWNMFPMQYVLSSLDDCMYIVIGFCKPCKGKYRALVSFRTGGTLQSRPDPSFLSQPSAMILAQPEPKVHHKNALSRPIGFLALAKSLTLKSFQGLNPQYKMSRHSYMIWTWTIWLKSCLSLMLSVELFDCWLGCQAGPKKESRAPILELAWRRNMCWQSISRSSEASD